MIGTITGCNKEKKLLLTNAVDFFCEKLLGKRMANGVMVDIEVRKKFEFKGECINEDMTRRSRWFTIVLRDEDPIEMIKTLAHEMVHVKQHVRNEIGKKHVILKKDSLIVLTEWNGSIWKPRPGEDEYYDSPWEIEAYGKEIGLAHQFANFWNGEK